MMIYALALGWFIAEAGYDFTDWRFYAIMIPVVFLANIQQTYMRFPK